MKTYNIFKESLISDTIVKELNAVVYTATFKRKGLQFAELCLCGRSFCIIGLNTCLPVHATLVDVIRIII